MITNLNTVSLYVEDQERALDFYVNKLGFEKRTDAEMGPGMRWIEVAPEGARTGFVLADAKQFEKADRVGSSADVTLHCDDLQGTYEKLRGEGVEVTEPVTEPWGSYVQVTDPDGHQFVISGA
ncbi:MAG TPA: VOC family protein [Actinomycetes bacterium]